ncbi:MAG: hypothetical protein R3A52_20120 [Polyangiales bacterium]
MVGPSDAGGDVSPTDLGATDAGLDAQSPIDAPTVDATDVVDALDAADDAPFRCASNADCVGREGPACDLTTAAASRA